MARERLAVLVRTPAALVGPLPPALLAGVAITVHAPSSATCALRWVTA